MSRLLVLLPVALWFIWADAAEPPAAVEPARVAMFLGGLTLAVLLAAWAAVYTARREAGGRSARQTLFGIARAGAIPVTVGWYAYCLFFLDWGQFVRLNTDHRLGPALATPGVVIATLPVYVAWALLLVAEYPALRQRRESRLLVDLDEGRAVYPPPTAWRYWTLALRQRLLLALVPLALLLLLRDAAAVGFWAAGVRRTMMSDVAMVMASALVVIAVSPELLRRVLLTHPLGPGSLRDRLEALGARTGLSMRNILVWDTQGTMVNAAVMGFLPRVRYVMLSDLLLDSLTPVQVEAVFAHEVGHVRHKHVLWYFVFLVGMTLFFAGPFEAAWRLLPPGPMTSTTAEVLVGFGTLGLILLLFGLLSRCFERQADVFAARTMQASAAPWAVVPVSGGPAVGAEGAAIFGSSLERAHNLNFASGAPGSRGRRRLASLRRLAEEMSHFLHGTIRSRIDYLHHLAPAPARTHRFDGRIVLVKAFVLALTVASATFLIVN